MNLRDKLIEALTSKDDESAFKTLCEINHALFGDTRLGSAFCRNPHSYTLKIVRGELLSFIHHGPTAVFELGDGGYSRIVLSRVRGKIFVVLSDVSPVRVKKAWEALLV